MICSNSTKPLVAGPRESKVTTFGPASRCAWTPPRRLSRVRQRRATEERFRCVAGRIDQLDAQLFEGHVPRRPELRNDRNGPDELVPDPEVRTEHSFGEGRRRLRRPAGGVGRKVEELWGRSCDVRAHDLGGPWTFEVADRHPARLEALVVLNTSAYAKLTTPPREAPLVRQLDAEVVTAHWMPLHERGTQAFRSFAQRLDASMAEFSRHAAGFKRLDIPATVIWGVEDPVLRHELIVPRFVAALGTAEADVHLLDAASHFLQQDRSR